MATRFMARAEGSVRHVLWGPLTLTLAALCGPLWPTYLGPQQATIGRALLIATVLGVAWDLVVAREPLRRPGWAAAGLLGALGLLAVWTALSGALIGCLCSGVAQGFAELAIMTGLAAVVGLYAPPQRLALVLGAATAGVLAGGLLALIGLRDLHATLYAPSASVDRLEGVYGNPNFLGYALALALPIPVAAALAWRGGRRAAALVTVVVLAALLADTYSRGSLLAAAAGVAVAVAVGFPRRVPRRVLIAVGVLVPAVAVALIVSPFYKSRRLEADFGTTQVQNTVGLDRSGWSTAAVGPIPADGARMANPPGSDVLVVTASAPGQGVNYDLGEAFGDARAGWEASVRSTATDVPIHWAVYDHDGGRVGGGTVHAGTRPRRVVSRFRSLAGHKYRIFAWSGGTTAFSLEKVEVTERRMDGVRASRRPIPTLLLGTSPDTLAQAEADYEGSRKAALRMALDVFAAHPIAGIGLEEFSRYAARHDRFGALPTHNTYTQVLAELGLIGALLLIAAGAVVVLSLVRGRPPTPLRAALAGTIVAGAVNLLFINGLAAPGNAMPLLLAVGFAAATAGQPPSWWPRLRRWRHVRDLRLRLGA